MKICKKTLTFHADYLEANNIHSLNSLNVWKNIYIFYKIIV